MNTPGPWKVNGFEGEIDTVSSENGTICLLYDARYELPLPDECDQEQTNANAHLIFAAPEMYKSLKKLREILGLSLVPDGYEDQRDKALKEAEQALTKAEGNE